MDNHTPAETWTRIAKMVEQSSGNGCWIYYGQHDRYGYGKYRKSNGQWVSPHRIAYEALVGEIPKGLVIDHLCRTRDCCNPTHLEPVTNRENIMRGETIAARNAAKTHCKRGHEFTPENIRRNKHGSRVCIECSRQSGIRARDKRRAAALPRD